MTRSEHGAAGPRRAAGALEAQVLAALWAAGAPLTPAAVQSEIGGELAYTTVMTILNRLHDKGVVTRERRGKAYAYAPVLERAEHAAAQMRAALDTSGDRPAALSRFLSALPPDDATVVRDLLGHGTPPERGGAGATR